MTRTRTLTAVVLTATLLTLTACSDDSEPDVTPTTPAPDNTTPPDDTDPTPTADEDSTLDPGGTYTWDTDGITATIDRVAEFTDISEYDTPVEPGHTPLRVYITLTNDGDRPVEVGDFDVTVEGATVGGEAQIADFEADARPFGGQISPGASAEFTADRTLNETYGTDIIVTIDRWDDPTLPRPQWAATIE